VKDVAVELRPVDGRDPRVRDAFAAIYEESFPPSEREDTAALLASLDGRRRGYLAWTDGDPVGLAVVFRLEGPRVEFLEYLAVEARRRSRGVGARMLEQLRPELDGADGVLFEVERPEDATGPAREVCERRIAFYLRNGAVVVECAPRYLAPDLEDKSKTVPYTLLWIPLADDAPAPAGARLRESVRAVLTQSYGLDEDDPLVAEVADGLAC
jgi:GNAT superfamily N-acetyltransferase